MNLIEESFQNKEEKNNKRASKIILVIIIVLVIAIIAVASYLAYIKSTTLKLTLDGQSNEKLLSLLEINEDGTIYVPIKECATYFGYESYNGEYSARSEEQSKCYVVGENEVANFELESNKIYKLDLTVSNGDYEYVYSKNPVKAKNGVLYATSEAIEKAFNVSFQYDQEKNRIYIYTLPYLVQVYSSKVLDYGYTQISDVFANQKTILQDMLVVQKGESSKQLGVIDAKGNVILEAKYDNITYLPEVGDFLVETNKKVGILSNKRETKIQIMYDSIELMDSDAGLYVVKKDDKYGVMDLKGNVKIYIENEQVGMDISKFEQNNIKNKYLLADNLIPVKKGGLWGLYDKNGNQLVDFEYDSFGYVASSNKDALNLLVIPNYNVIVACKDKKYTLLNASGEKLFDPVADDIYMTISGGEKHYHISVNNRDIDAEEYLDSRGVASQNKTTTRQTEESTTVENNNNEQEESEQEEQQNNQEQQTEQ